MSCQPSYTFRPTDRASPPQSSAFVFTEHRSRLFASGTFFRSIEQGTAENDISVEAIVTQITPPNDYEITFNVYILGVLQETFIVSQVVIPMPLPAVCSGGINALRSAVNDVITGSNIIEMTARGVDIFDIGGMDPDNNCVTAIGPINMAGGDGPPTGANQAFLDSLFTGTERSIIMIATTENITGFSVTPGTDRRVQQWDGIQWIQYANLVQGSCPLDGPPV